MALFLLCSVAIAAELLVHVVLVLLLVLLLVLMLLVTAVVLVLAQVLVVLVLMLVSVLVAACRALRRVHHDLSALLLTPAGACRLLAFH